MVLNVIPVCVCAVFLFNCKRSVSLSKDQTTNIKHVEKISFEVNFVPFSVAIVKILFITKIYYAHTLQ